MKTFPKIEQLEGHYGIIRTGGDGLPSPQWQATQLSTIRSPYPLRLAWKPAESIFRVRCHRMVRGPLSQAFDGILKHYRQQHGEGALKKIQEDGMDLFGGCYAFGLNGSDQLSLHSYGAAICLNPAGNPKGKRPDKCTMPKEVVEIFQKIGAVWGGDDYLKPDCSRFFFISK